MLAVLTFVNIHCVPPVISHEVFEALCPRVVGCPERLSEAQYWRENSFSSGCRACGGRSVVD